MLRFLVDIAVDAYAIQYAFFFVLFFAIPSFPLI